MVYGMKYKIRYVHQVISSFLLLLFLSFLLNSFLLFFLLFLFFSLVYFLYFFFFYLTFKLFSLISMNVLLKHYGFHRSQKCSYVSQCGNIGH
jgi:hypothetical protein